MESFSKGLTFKGKEGFLVDFVSQEASLSKLFVKGLLSHGSVWLKQKDSSLKRVRRAKTLLQDGDRIEVHYSSKIEDLDVEKLCYPIKEYKDWGVWFKGVNVLTQGTKYGDQNSIFRLLEKKKQNVFMINRLDKEASGLIVFAYTKKMAATLSKIWGEESTEKKYQIIVKGNMLKKFTDKKGQIKKKLQGKESLTLFEVERAEKEYSLVVATLKTGRFHQIRRHFEAIKHPLLGDPRYGRGNKNREGLQLQSTFLKLKNPNPQNDNILSFEVPKKDQLFSNFKDESK